MATERVREGRLEIRDRWKEGTVDKVGKVKRKESDGWDVLRKGDAWVDVEKSQLCG